MGRCQHYKLLCVLTLELHNHKHGVRPEPDVLYTSVPL